MLEHQTRVAVMDGHPLVLCALQKAFAQSDHFDVAGTANGAADTMALLSQRACDVVVTNYALAGGADIDGWRFLSTLACEHPALPVVVYCDFDDPFLIGGLVQRGVEAIVCKRDEMSEVLIAACRAARGETYLSPLAQAAFDQFRGLPHLSRFATLTRRQMEIAGLMLCGLSVVQTAKLLRRSVNTISAQRTAACRRLGFAGEADAYRYVIAHGLSLDRMDESQGGLAA